MRLQLFVIFSLLTSLAYGQVIKDTVFSKSDPDSAAKSHYVSFFSDVDPLTILEEKNSKGKKKKKKKSASQKKKSKYYFGARVKKRYLTEGYGPRQELIMFSFMKKKRYVKPSIYPKYIYWFNKEKNKIMKTSAKKVDKSVATILHGPYEKKVGGLLMERGYYFEGTKHGRWERYAKPRTHVIHKGEGDSVTKEITTQTLLDKQYWKKGFPESSEITYWDIDRTKVKEVKPRNGEGQLHGYYFKYFKNGEKEEYGKYQFDQKIGKWYLYSKGPTRVRRKRITQWRKKPFEEFEDPLVVKEWDDDGNLIMENGKTVTVRKRKRGGRR